MNHEQIENKREKLLVVLSAYRKLKNEVTSIKELSEKLGDGFSTSTLQRYFHELNEKKIVTQEEYTEICEWLNNNKLNSTSKGGKNSQALHGYSKDENGRFTGGKK